MVSMQNCDELPPFANQQTYLLLASRRQGLTRSEPHWYEPCRKHRAWLQKEQSVPRFILGERQMQMCRDRSERTGGGDGIGNA